MLNLHNKVIQNKANIKAFYDRNAKFHEFNSNENLELLFSDVIKRLSPKIIALLGAPEDRCK